MKTFYLKTVGDSDRLYLSEYEPTPKETLVETINAKDRDAARDKLRPNGYEKYEHRPGYGYFMVGT